MSMASPHIGPPRRNIRLGVRQATDEIILRAYHVSSPTRGLVKAALMLSYTGKVETPSDVGGLLYPAHYSPS
jgi:hypothetical protein